MMPHMNQMAAVAWLMAMMLSPETLALQGQIASAGGVFFLLPLAGALLLHGVNIAASPWPDEITPLQSTYGVMGTSLLLLTARTVVTVCLATATLVTAGFVFNEVFVYWFPNFGFAGLLLVILVGLNLAGRRSAAMVQIVFTATAFIGLGVLVLAGLGGHSSESRQVSVEAMAVGPVTLGLSVIALIGYDLLRYTSADLDDRQAKLLSGIAIAALGLLFGAWNATALAYVGPSRLADTSIPHILTAKAVMGPSGRILIGIVVIAGSCAAVNLLFQAVSRMMADMANHDLLPATAGMSSSRPWLPLLGLGGLTGLLMTLGFAGSDWLDVSLRGGLVLWTITIGLGHLALLLRRGDRAKRPDRSAPRSLVGALAHLTLVVVMPFLGIALIVSHDDPTMLLRAILTLIVLIAGLATAGCLAARRLIRRRRKASYPKEGVSQ